MTTSATWGCSARFPALPRRSTAAASGTPSMGRGSSGASSRRRLRRATRISCARSGSGRTRAARRVRRSVLSPSGSHGANRARPRLRRHLRAVRKSQQAPRLADAGTAVYPAVPLTEKWWLGRNNPTTGRRSWTINHPRRALLRSRLVGDARRRPRHSPELPRHGARATVIVVEADGSTVTLPDAERDGFARGRTLRPRRVRRVDLVLSNGSTRTACWRDRVFPPFFCFAARATTAASSGSGPGFVPQAPGGDDPLQELLRPRSRGAVKISSGSPCSRSLPRRGSRRARRCRGRTTSRASRSASSCRPRPARG